MCVHVRAALAVPASLALLPDFSYASVQGLLSGACNSTLLSLLVLCLCWHSQLGVQVVIEDYVRGWARMVSLILNAFAHVVLGALGLLAIVRLALGMPA